MDNPDTNTESEGAEEATKRRELRVKRLFPGRIAQWFLHRLRLFDLGRRRFKSRPRSLKNQ